MNKECHGPAGCPDHEGLRLSCAPSRGGLADRTLFLQGRKDRT